MFERFACVEEIERKLLGCITKYRCNLKNEEQKSAVEDTQSLPAAAAPLAGLPSAAVSIEDSPISNEDSSFLRDLFARMEETRAAGMQALDVARSRLLSGMVYRPGNDERSLGAHDANEAPSATDVCVGACQARGGGLQNRWLHFTKLEEFELRHDPGLVSPGEAEARNSQAGTHRESPETPGLVLLSMKIPDHLRVATSRIRGKIQHETCTSCCEHLSLEVQRAGLSAYNGSGSDL